MCSFLFELADFEADLELHFLLEGADARVPSLHTTTAAATSLVSFWVKDGVLESFLEGPLPARTLRAFFSACSSNSISSLSLAEAPASDVHKHYTDDVFFFCLFLSFTVQGKQLKITNKEQTQFIHHSSYGNKKNWTAEVALSIYCTSTCGCIIGTVWLLRASWWHWWSVETCDMWLHTKINTESRVDQHFMALTDNNK